MAARSPGAGRGPAADARENRQLTLPPGTKHWFQAPAEGAVFYSFSTCVRDSLDRFTDPAIVRQVKIEED